MAINPEFSNNPAKVKAVNEVVNEVGVSGALEGFFADKVTLSAKAIEEFKNETADHAKALDKLSEEAVYNTQSFYPYMGVTANPTFTTTATSSSDVNISFNLCVSKEEAYSALDAKSPSITKEDVEAMAKTVMEQPVIPPPPIFSEKQWNTLKNLGADYETTISGGILKTKKKAKTAKGIMVSVPVSTPVDFVPLVRNKKKLEFHILKPHLETNLVPLCDSVIQPKNWDVLSPTDCVTAMQHFSSYICAKCNELNYPGT